MLTPQEQVALGNGAFLSRGSPHGVKGLARMPLLTRRLVCSAFTQNRGNVCHFKMSILVIFCIFRIRQLSLLSDSETFPPP